MAKLFLKPVGGLCNRMRSIDSALALCNKYNYELVIIWVLDHALNCRFHDLFEPLQNNLQKAQVVDMPIGFPERYSPKYKKLLSSNSPLDILRPLLLWHQPNFSATDISKTFKALQDIPEQRILLNDYFAKIYDSTRDKINKEISELDDHLINRINLTLNQLMTSKQNLFIESCYRLTNNDKRYDCFVPVKELKKRISKKEVSLKNSIGVHIRQTDHVVAINKSPLGKFITAVTEEIKKDSDVRFYLSTDNSDVIELLKEKFKDNLDFQNVESYDRNTPVAIQNAMIDLYCLANTKFIYGSHQSTFNQTAADIGKIKLITI